MRIIKPLLATIAMLVCSATMNAHDFEVDGIFYNILSKENKTVEVTFSGNTYSSKANEYTENVTIPQKVEYEGNEYMVTGIGAEAFRGCFKLLNVNIPEGITKIGSSAFRECKKLSSIIIPEGVTSIGDLAFNGCSSLASVVIPEGVTSIGKQAFYGCTSLVSVIIPEGMTSIGNYTFKGCTSLTSVVIPEGVTSIGYGAFQECTNLTSVVISEGLTTIYYDVFAGCTSLTSVVIPKSVTSIGSSAFSGCTSLISVKSLSLEEPSVGDRAFNGISANAVLYVPEGAVYQNWYPYFSRVEHLTEEEMTGIENVMLDVKQGVTYDLKGRNVDASKNRGIYN